MTTGQTGSVAELTQADVVDPDKIPPPEPEYYARIHRDLDRNAPLVAAAVRFLDHHVANGPEPAIWQLHRPTFTGDYFGCRTCWDGYVYDSAPASWPCSTAGALLDFYAAEPGYDQQWRHLRYWFDSATP